MAAKNVVIHIEDGIPTVVASDGPVTVWFLDADVDELPEEPFEYSGRDVGVYGEAFNDRDVQEAAPLLARLRAYVEEGAE